MKYKYSTALDVFYPVDMLDAYTDLPTDLMDVSEQAYDAVLHARSQGLAYRIADDGASVSVAPSSVHDWDVKSGAWVLTVEKAAELKATELASAKAAKLSEIADAAQQLVDKIVTDAAPAFERETYALQAAETLAWSRDKTAKTPVLDGIAAARGVPAEFLKAKALEKSQQYQALCGAVAGQRQAFEDKVNAATDVASVALIVPVYRVS